MKFALISTVLFTFVSVFLVSCTGTRETMKTSKTSPIEPFKKVTLPNGLDVIIKEAHTAPVVAVYLWCRTGSMNETPDEQGISHFYEHMFFKGTEKRGVGEIDRAIKSLGGYNNAFTSKEYTAYYVVLPLENFSLAADVLVDAIRNSSFPADEIRKECNVISEEINRKDDDPMGTLYEEMFKVMFPGTPYSHPVLGSKESISALTRDDFKRYLAKFYVPNNMTAVVVGDVETSDVINEFKSLTVDWLPDTTVKDRMVNFSIPQRKGILGFTLEKEVNMSYVMIAFRSSGLADKHENAILDVASTIIGEGRSSRLYKRIIERDELASSVQAFIYPLTKAGMFVVTGTMDSKNVPKFREAVIEEIGRLGVETITEEELKKAKTMLKADFQFSNETASDLAQTLGHYNTLDMLDDVTEYERTIDAVTQKDIHTCCSQVLTPDSYTIGVINPRISTEKEVRGE